MFVDLVDVGVLEDERACLEPLETEAAGENVEGVNGEGLAGLLQEQVLEFQDLDDLFLDLHVVVEPVVADSFLVSGEGGGLGHGSRESQGVQVQQDCPGGEFGFGFEESCP